jgi:hypothetical protein
MDFRHADGSSTAVNKEVAAMRSAGAGLFGALLMVAPLVAIPILAVVGVPQFAPAVAPTPLDAVDAELDSDLSPDQDRRAVSSRPAGRGSKTIAHSTRSHLNASSAHGRGEDLFGEYPGEVADEPTPSDDLENATGSESGSMAGLESAHLELDPEADPVEVHDSPSRPGTAKSGAGRSGHRPLPEPRSRRGDAGNSRDASVPEVARVWTNQTPGAALTGWEEDTDPVPANRSRAATRLAQADAAADPVDVMADLGSDSPAPARAAPRAPPSSQPPAKRSAPARDSGRAAPPTRSPVRSIPEEGTGASAPLVEEFEAVLDSAVELADASASNASALSTDLGNDAVDEVDDRLGEVTRDRLQRKFRDPLGQASPTATPRAKSPAARQPARNVSPDAELGPSDADLAQATPLVERNARNNAAKNPAADEQDSSDASLGTGDVETEVLDEEATGAPADASTDDLGAELGQLTWKQANARLKGWGIRKHNVDYNGETGRFTFRCLAPDPNFTQVSQRFEAEGDDPLSAVNAALVQISDWYRQRTRRRAE